MRGEFGRAPPINRDAWRDHWTEVMSLPDLDGCVAAGDDRSETMSLMREAIEFHLEGLIAEGCAVPTPQSESTYVEVDA